MKLVLQLIQTDSTGRAEEFTKEVIRVGRDPDNDLVLPDAAVSRHHAEIRLDGEAWGIFDLDSTNGTYVNGQRKPDALLYESDVVEFGPRGPRIRVSLPGMLRPVPSPGARSPNERSQSAEPTGIFPHPSSQNTRVVEGTPATRPDLANNLERWTAGIIGGALLGWLGAWLRNLRGPTRPRRTMPCAGCGASLNSGVKFCSACGRAVPEACANCGAALEHDTKFCPACATSVGGSARPAAAVARAIKWWRSLGKTTPDRVFVIGTALFFFGMVEWQLAFPLFKLGALGIGIYLFIKGDQKRGAGLTLASMVMIVVLSMLQGGHRSAVVSAPLDHPRGTQGVLKTTPGLPQPRVPQFKAIQADVVSIRVPADWKVVVASLQNHGVFWVMGPNGEGISIWELNFIANEESRQRALYLLRDRGAAGAMLMRTLPPVMEPRPPLDAWQTLLAHNGQPAEILESAPLTDDQTVVAARTRSLVDLDKVRASLEAVGHTLPPGLHGRVQHEGLILVRVIPPFLYNGVFDTWSMLTIGCDGPVAWFRQNAALCVASLGTLQVSLPPDATQPPLDPGRLAKIAQAPFNNMMQNDPRYREQMRALTATLGGDVIVEGPWGTGRVPIPDAPRSGACWQCANGLVEHGDYPTPSCAGAMRCRVLR